MVRSLLVMKEAQADTSQGNQQSGMGGGPPGGGAGKDEKDKKVCQTLDTQKMASDCAVEGQAQVRAASTANHSNWPQEAQAARP